MSYVEPTVESFKARHPEFSGVSDALVSLVLDDSFAFIGDNWHEDDRARAQRLWTAHTLTLEGEPQRSESIAKGETVANGQNGPMKSMKVGDVSVTYADRSSSSSSNVGSMADEYCKTTYGAQFYELMARNISPVAVV